MFTQIREQARIRQTDWGFTRTVHVHPGMRSWRDLPVSRFFFSSSDLMSSSISTDSVLVSFPAEYGNGDSVCTSLTISS